jgi:2',3'-cyclic-nucleotide 2'-phosphodiesterase (5'-nucleotidase family)
MICRALLSLLFVVSTLGAQERLRQLTILHTNDLHAHLLPDSAGIGGFAYVAAAVNRERAGCTTCIYLNAGDLVQGTPVSTMFHGLPIYEIANGLGIDAAVVGNHEFDYGWQKVQEFAHSAKYPLLSANIVNAAGATITGKAYTILNTGGVRVGVIGVVMSDMIGALITPESAGPFHVLPAVETVRKYARELVNRTDLIVVLGHIYNPEADAILQEVPEVSVVVAGHAHKGFEQMHRTGSGVAVLCNGYGRELGRLDLKVANHKIQSAEWKRIPIDSHTIEPDPSVAASVAHWEGKVSKIVDVPIGEARRQFNSADLQPIVEAGLAAETGADFAYMNSGGIRDSLPAGRILARQIWNMLPFDNQVLIGKFKGSELPEEIAHGRNLDPIRVYNVATLDYVVDMRFRERRAGFTNTNRLLRDVMIDWIKKKRILE